jgi:magnesium-transporting ATPase (P-type)
MLKACIVQNSKNDLNKHDVHCRQRLENHDDVQFVKFFNVLVIVIAIVVVIAVVVVIVFVIVFVVFFSSFIVSIVSIWLIFSILMISFKNENVFLEICFSRDNCVHNECNALFEWWRRFWFRKRRAKEYWRWLSWSRLIRRKRNDWHKYSKIYWSRNWFSLRD